MLTKELLSFTSRRIGCNMEEEKKIRLVVDNKEPPPKPLEVFVAENVGTKTSLGGEKDGKA